MCKRLRHYSPQFLGCFSPGAYCEHSERIVRISTNQSVVVTKKSQVIVYHAVKMADLHDLALEYIGFLRRMIRVRERCY